MKIEIVHNFDLDEIEKNILVVKYKNSLLNPILYILNVECMEDEIIIGFLVEACEPVEIKDFILSKKNETLFFSLINHWGIIKLNLRKILKHEVSFDTYFFIEKIENSIIIDKEIEVESYSLKGNLIDKIPVDPPTEVLNNYNKVITYESPVWGVQKLKIE